MLQHGSVLLRDDQTRLMALAAAEDESAPAVATLGELLETEPSPADFGTAARASLRSMTGTDSIPLEASDVERLAGPHVQSFRDERWTWRA